MLTAVRWSRRDRPGRAPDQLIILLGSCRTLKLWHPDENRVPAGVESRRWRDWIPASAGLSAPGRLQEAPWQIGRYTHEG